MSSNAVRIRTRIVREPVEQEQEPAAYGHDVSEYPDLDSRGRVVRQLLAGKRVLMVLDNVRSSQEVVPLLPPSGSCAVLITTRRHDLSVTRGTYRFQLGLFSREKREALALFARILSLRRARQEEAILAEIADVLGHLPLAIAIHLTLCLAPRQPGKLGYRSSASSSVRSAVSLSQRSIQPPGFIGWLKARGNNSTRAMGGTGAVISQPGRYP
jgi:hypothetical protein